MQILSQQAQVGPEILHFSQTRRQCGGTDARLGFEWVTGTVLSALIPLPSKQSFPHTLLSTESFASPTA